MIKMREFVPLVFLLHYKTLEIYFNDNLIIRSLYAMLLIHSHCMTMDNPIVVVYLCCVYVDMCLP